MSEQETIIVDGRKATDLLRTVLGIGGVLALVVGLLIVFNPVQTTKLVLGFVAILLAIYMVVAGLVFLGSIIFSKTMSGWRRVGNAALGLLYLIIGIIVFANLENTAIVLAAFLSILIGVAWIFEGVLAFASAKQSRSKTWSIIYGIISIIAGIVLIFSPLLSVVVLWVILGASMAVMGLIQIVRAFTLKP